MRQCVYLISVNLLEKLCYWNIFPQGKVLLFLLKMCSLTVVAVCNCWTLVVHGGMSLHTIEIYRIPRCPKSLLPSCGVWWEDYE